VLGIPEGTRVSAFDFYPYIRTLARTMSTHAHAHHAHDIDFKKAFTVTKEPGSQVKIEGEIPYSELEHERARAPRTEH
jgi:hypothetical protein